MVSEPEALIDKIGQVLGELEEETTGLIAATLVTRTGLPICSHIAGKIDEAHLSASLAALLNLAVELSNNLFNERPSRLIVDTGMGSIIIRDVNPESVLAVICRKQHLGAILILVEKAARQISELIPPTWQPANP